jgi:hypothetical protein
VLTLDGLAALLVARPLADEHVELVLLQALVQQASSEVGALHCGAAGHTRTWALVAAAAGFGLFQAATAIALSPGSLPGAASRHGFANPGVPGHGLRVRAAFRRPGAGRSCDEAVHTDLVMAAEKPRPRVLTALT